MEHLDKVFYSGRKFSTDEANSYNNNSNKFGTSDNARVIDKYDLLNNNCVSKAIEGVKAGGTKENFLQDTGPIAPDIPSLQYQPVSPSDLNNHLKSRADSNNSNVKEVTKAMNTTIDN
jgi:hypothetical protein